MQKSEIPQPIAALLQRIKKLPTPSPVYFDMIAYFKNPAASFVGAARIIESDVAMTTELLKLTNSLQFASSYGIASPLQAIRVLGFDILCSMVLQLGLFQNATSSLFEQNLIGMINTDSCNIANIARRIARLEGFSPIRIEEAVCAGMLSSVGALVLLECLPDGFKSVIGKVAQGEDPLDAEMAEFGVDHFALGGFCLREWGFKAEVMRAVALAGRPSSDGSAVMDVSAVVHVARVVAGPFPGYFVGSVPRDHLGRVALDMEKIRRIGKEHRIASWMAEAAKAT